MISKFQIQSSIFKTKINLFAQSFLPLFTLWFRMNGSILTSFVLYTTVCYFWCADTRTKRADNVDISKWFIRVKKTKAWSPWGGLQEIHRNVILSSVEAEQRTVSEGSNVQSNSTDWRRLKGVNSAEKMDMFKYENKSCNLFTSI